MCTRTKDQEATRNQSESIQEGKQLKDWRIAGYK